MLEASAINFYNHEGHEGKHKSLFSSVVRCVLCGCFLSSLNGQQERLFERFRDPAEEAGGVGTVH